MDNLPSLDIKMEFDPSLEDAYKEAELSKNLTPLIKQELKYTILNRRHKSGQGELVLEEKKNPPKRELTADEIRKKLRRKEQNRRAAARCRQKKKHLAEHVLEEYLKEQQNTALLHQEIETLRREKEKLERVLSEHAFTCMRAPTPTPVTPAFDETTTFQYGFNQSPYPRDSLTPNYQENQDPFDDPNMLYYQEFAPIVKVPVNQAPTCTQTCTQTLTDPLGDIDLPETFLDLNFLQPASPDIQNGGRTSISDYIDTDIAGAH